MATIFTDALALTKAPNFERTGENTWTAAVRGEGTLMGSVLIVQSLRAVADAVPDKLIHAFHIQFVGRGSIDKTVKYVLEITTAGKSTTTSMVRAYQDGVLLSIIMVSSALPAKTEKPRWDDLETLDDVKRIPESKSLVHTFLDYAGFETSDAENSIRYFPFWFRYRGELKDAHEAILAAAYVTDQGISNTGFPDHVPFDESIMNLTLNHSAWFHHPVVLDEWVCVKSRCSAQANGRGIAHGLMATESGRRIATFSQEVLLLTPSNEILKDRPYPSA